MEREYRQIIQNIKLSKTEAKTLYDAFNILQDALSNIFNTGCEYDKDLVEAINKGIDGLKVCNPRLNVDLIVEE